MTDQAAIEQVQNPRLTNGAGAAALLSAGLGCITLAVLAIIADNSPVFKKWMIFYTPTGPLSGVTATAVAAWLLCWIALDAAWKRRNVYDGVVATGLVLIAISFVLMFPPVGDLF